MHHFWAWLLFVSSLSSENVVCLAVMYAISDVFFKKLYFSLVQGFAAIDVALLGPLNVCFCHKAVLGQKVLHYDFGTLTISADVSCSKEIHMYLFSRC